MFDQCSNSYILAFQYIQSLDLFSIPPTPTQVKLYAYQLLYGLNHAHSKAIMHRDIKPQNILIDQKTKCLKIIDWGLAQYYLPSKQYNVRVASRYYKAPQLLLNNNYYDMSIDIWSVGCWLASIVFGIDVFFKGTDNIDQMKKITNINGSRQVVNYVKKYKLNVESSLKNWLQCTNISPVNNKQRADKQVLDLIQKMLRIDHKQRINVLQALQHPYFKQLYSC